MGKRCEWQIRSDTVANQQDDSRESHKGKLKGALATVECVPLGQHNKGKESLAMMDHREGKRESEGARAQPIMTDRFSGQPKL